MYTSIRYVAYCNDIIITFSYEKDTADTDRLISSFYEWNDWLYTFAIHGIGT